MVFNGVELTALDPCFSIAAEIPPGGPGRDVKQLGSAHGPWFVRVQPEGEPYRVDVNIICDTRQEVHEKRTKLAAWALTNEPRELIPTWRPNVHYMAVCSSMSDLVFQVWNVATVTILFDLFGGCSLDNALSTAEGEGAVSISAGGNHVFYPVTRLTLAEETERVSLMWDNVEFFRLNGAFMPGNVVEIDFGTLSVLWNNQHAEKLVEYPFSQWRPGFTPGLHSLAGPGFITVEWRNAWL